MSKKLVFVEYLKYVMTLEIHGCINRFVPDTVLTPSY